MRFIVSFLQRFITTEQSPQRLALSFCIGNYIAFSPYIGFHTIMAVIMSYFFRLNLSLVVAVSYGVNNPWTAIPLYALDYMFGYWLLHTVLRIGYLPIWSYPQIITHFFEHTLALPTPCLWSFLIGGNFLGIITSILLYPLVVKLFTYYKQQVTVPTGSI